MRLKEHACHTPRADSGSLIEPTQAPKGMLSSHIVKITFYLACLTGTQCCIVQWCKHIVWGHTTSHVAANKTKKI